MMPRRLFAVCAVITFVLSWASFVLAQGMGGSAFHNSGMGSSGFGSSGFGMGGMGGGFGSGGSGMSGFGAGLGSNSLGSAGFGSSQFGSNGFGSAGFGGSGFGSSGNGSGYGGGQYGGGGQSFVGRDATDMQGVFGQTSRSSNQFIQQMTRNMGQTNRRQRQNNKTQQNPPQPMRVEVRVAFNPPQQTSTQLADTIRTRLTKILSEHQMSPAGLHMEGATAVISGVAASESERDVIAQLIALQPGVDNIRNEMTVGAPPSEAVVPSPGS